MISFNTAQTLLFNVGIDTFSIIIILIIHYNSRRHTANTQAMRLLRGTMLMTVVMSVTDIFMWLLNGVPGMAARIAAYVDNIAYFMVQLVVVFTWFRYVWYRTYKTRLPRKINLFAIVVPFCVITAIIVSSPWTRWCFYLDETNIYHRGPLSAPLSVVALSYLAAASAFALDHRRKEVFADRRNEFFILGFFSVPPLLGGIAQTVLYGCSLLWPCVTISILLIYISLENHAISQDALTGLNNRGNLDRYLHSNLDNLQGCQAALIMIDVNCFKQINDCLGHGTGDEALIYTAEVLKNTFCKTSAFLARYGGDEFAVVITDGGETDAENAVKRIRRSFETFNESHCLPYRISVSMGYAVCPSPGVDGPDSLIKNADRRMYLDKEVFHRSNLQVVNG